MAGQTALELKKLDLKVVENSRSSGGQGLQGLVDLSESAIGQLHQLRRDQRTTTAAALLGRLRGTGRGVSFTRLVEELERAYPLELEYPFEGSDRVGGGVWIARDLLGGSSTTSVAKLRWDNRALDLPMHVHDHSDRFIIVLKGRGYFHVTDESVDEFTGTHVRSVPARERDVFLFTRGTVHTFSTEDEPMTLLSCQLPFLAFDDPRQYRLPKVIWTAKEHRSDPHASVACDPAWSVLAERPIEGPTAFADLLAVAP